jgi:hypothetical protein
MRQRETLCNLSLFLSLSLLLLLFLTCASAEESLSAHGAARNITEREHTEAGIGAIRLGHDLGSVVETIIRTKEICKKRKD